ncbi:MAG: class I SAM-dependent RNA methyltransferase [Chlamydiales bacterium]|nr:class I SAM-dependent RNA methyltransferase [Chlamydiales bacterium]
MLVEITDLSSSGEGVGHVDGMAVFVDGALPGERVKLKDLIKKKRFAKAQLEKVVEASPDRVKPVCPLFGTCGGCQIMHLDYEKQLEFKRKRVQEALRRIGGFDIEVEKCIPSPRQLGYRNKIHLHNGGFYKKHSHEIVKVDRCYIHNEIGEKALPSVHGVKEAIIKTSFADGQVMRVVDGVADKEAIYETLGDLRFEIGPRDFFQINPEQALNLYRVAIEFAGIKKGDHVLDAYCGVGCLALFASKVAKSVHGIESGRQAILRAKKNAELNGVKNVSFECGHVEQSDLACDVLFINPPRGGLAEGVVDRIKARTCVYISCDPATLARDLKKLSSYRLVKVQPLDMFPQTVHVETVCLLQR